MRVIHNNSRFNDLVHLGNQYRIRIAVWCDESFLQRILLTFRLGKEWHDLELDEPLRLFRNED